MSKEYLESLEKIKQEFNCDPEYYGLGGAFEILESALHRLESIDNANPSEALELLGFMGNFIIPTALGNKHLKDFCDKEFAIIKQALLKAQEQEKFFDDKLVFKNGCIMSGFDYKGKQIVAMPLKEYAEFMKQKKVLDIIKEKDVDIYILNHCKTVDEYNSKIVHIIGEIRELTQDEFDLLKRC